MGGVVSALADSIRLHLLSSSLTPNLLLLPHHHNGRRQIQMQQQLQQRNDDNNKLRMDGIRLAIGSSILSSLLLAPNLLKLLPKQQQQHNDDNHGRQIQKKKKIVVALGQQLRQLTQIQKKVVVVVGQQPCSRQPTQNQKKINVVVVGGIVSALVGSFLSSLLAPNFFHFLPRRRRIQMQHNRGRQIQIVVVDQQPRQPTQISLLTIAEGEDTIYTFNFGPRGMIPLATCHGMFLSEIGFPERLAIWDPTTRSCNKKKDMIRIIPQSSVPRPPFVEYEFVLTYGFGFDPSSNDYKVIRFLEFEFEDGTKSKLVELYSLKTNSWKQIAYPHGATGYGSDLTCVYTSDGFCYCRTSDDHLVFIPFDLANDNFPPALIPGPDTLRSSFAPVEFEGSLAVISYQEKPFEFELWVWNKNNESWSLRGAWAIDGDPDNCYCPPGQFFNNGVLFLQNSKDELVIFDCAKQTLKILGMYDPFVYVFPYNVDSEIKDRKQSFYF